MTIVKVLYVDANGDYSEVRNTADTIQAFGFDASGEKITSVANGTVNSDAVNFGQLQAAVNGFDWKQSVRAATTANITLSGTQTIDGVALIAGNRVLVKNQTLPEENGIYVVAAGAWSRSVDADADVEVTAGLTVAVEEGTTLQDHIFMLMTNDPIVVGTTALSFQKIVVNSLVGGAGINFAGETISADLYSGGGIKFVGAGDAGQLAVEPNDFAGDGLVDDGSDNLAIDWATSPWNMGKAIKSSDLNSNASGYGASIIGIEDAGNFTAQTSVEGALQELYGLTGNRLYTVGAGGVTKGDLLYMSAANTVSKMPINASHVAVGLATSTQIAGASVAVQRIDYVVPGCLVGATADTKYYWNGTALTTTLPPSSGNYVWTAGVAVNATDLLAVVEFIKRNA